MTRSQAEQLREPEGSRRWGETRRFVEIDPTTVGEVDLTESNEQGPLSSCHLSSTLRQTDFEEMANFATKLSLARVGTVVRVYSTV